MTIQETLVLLRLQIIPLYLIDGWFANKNTGKDPVESRVGKMTEYINSANFKCMAFIFWGVVMATGFLILFVPNIVTIGLATVFGCCFFAAGFLWRRQATAFGKDLMNLKESLWFRYTWEWRGFLSHTQETMKLRVDEVLTSQASDVKVTEIKHGINSQVAYGQRKRFADTHAICLKFRLAEEKYNRYYELADRSAAVMEAQAETNEQKHTDNAKSAAENPKSSGGTVVIFD